MRPISADLGLSHATVGAILGAWPLVYVASAVPCGALLDRVGLRGSLALAAAIIGARFFVSVNPVVSAPTT